LRRQTKKSDPMIAPRYAGCPCQRDLKSNCNCNYNRNGVSATLDDGIPSRLGRRYSNGLEKG
jgi:hypothetical protein